MPTPSGFGTISSRSTPTAASAWWSRTSRELLGSAGTVAANADLADGADEVVIIYADNLSDIDLRPCSHSTASMTIR